MNREWKSILGAAGIIGLALSLPITASAQRTSGSGNGSISGAASSQSLSNSAQYPPGRASATTQLASVDVNITPKDAEIYVDGRSVGLADQYMAGGETLKLTPGGHIIVIYHPEYRSVRVSVEFATGRRYLLQREMLELQAFERSMTPLAATFLFQQDQPEADLKPIVYVAAAVQ